jgi:hypothetical protein
MFEMPKKEIYSINVLSSRQKGGLEQHLLIPRSRTLPTRGKKLARSLPASNKQILP